MAKPAFWEASEVHLGSLVHPFGTLGHHFCILAALFWWFQGPLGHPMGHLGVQMRIFIDFLSISGISWNPFRGGLGDFALTWVTEVTVWVPWIDILVNWGVEIAQNPMLRCD